jgi:L-glyceraldehyde 3-phosphate reductase
MLRELGTPCLINQVSYSMFNRWIEADLIGAAAEEGVGLIFFSPLAQGLLTDRYLSGMPNDSRAVRSGVFLRREQITEAALAKARRLNEIARARGQSLAQMALAWVLRHPAATSALIGASTVRQVEDNVAAANQLSFTDGELQAIEAALAQN